MNIGRMGRFVGIATLSAMTLGACRSNERADAGRNQAYFARCYNTPTRTATMSRWNDMVRGLTALAPNARVVPGMEYVSFRNLTADQVEAMLALMQGTYGDMAVTASASQNSFGVSAGPMDANGVCLATLVVQDDR